MKNIKGIFLLTTVLMLLLTISAINATDVDNNADIIEDVAISSHDSTITTDISTTQDTNTNTKENKKIIKNDLNTKENVKSATTHTITNDTVDQIFSGFNYTLGDSVNDGDTLDFQGTIDKVHGLIVDKKVTILSSTGDAVISLHSEAGDRSGNPPPNSFQFRTELSGSTISGLYLYNTECWIHNINNAVFKNMTMYVDGKPVGNGVGQTSLRYCDNVTMENCYIYTKDNGGSSSFVWTGCNNCTLINSTVEGEGSVGNILYVGNPYNTADIPEGFNITNYNFDNKIINCTALGGSGGISNPLQNLGKRTLIQDNKFYSGGSAQSGTNGTVIGNEFYRTVSLSLSSDSVACGNVFYGTGSADAAYNAVNIQLYNNTLNNVNLANGAASVFENNTVKGKLTINKVSNIKNNNLTNVQINSNGKTSNITNNNVTGNITSAAANVTIEDNNITTNNEYTVVITGANNTVRNNYLVAKFKVGDESISTTQASTVIEGNTPESGKNVNITDETYSQYFSSNGRLYNTEISDYDTITLQGAFNNKNFIFDNVKITVQGDNATINNGYIQSTGTATLMVKDLTMNDTEDNYISTVLFNSDSNTLRNVTIYRYSRDTNYNTLAIRVIGNKNIIENNSINMDVTTRVVDFTAEPRIAKVAAITILSSNNTVQKNNIKAKTTSTPGGTLNVIQLAGTTETPSDSNIVTGNTIEVDGTDYIYGINLGPFTDQNTVTSNTIKITSDEYAAGIQIMNGPSNDNKINSNTINLETDSYAYGIVISAWEKPEVAGNTFNSNKITVTAPQSYGMELASGNQSIIIKETTVDSNTITSEGNYSIGIAFLGQNSTISRNTITVTGTTNATLEDTTDIIKPTTAGIILQNSTDINDYNNTITATKGANHLLINTTDSRIISTLSSSSRYINAVDNTNIVLNSSNNNTINTQRAFTTGQYCVELIASSNNTIYGNELNASNTLGGNEAVTVDSESKDNTIVDNTPTIRFLTDDTYSQLFDENGVYKYPAGVLYLAGDLHGKDLIFNDSITFTNLGDYTIYNGTIIMNENPNGYTSKDVYINYININNVDKPAFIDNLTTTAQRNIYITGGDITISGDEIVAIESVKEDITYVRLYPDGINFNLSGKDVIAVKMTRDAYTRNDYIDLENCNINIEATGISRALVAENVNLDVIENEITLTGSDVLAVYAKDVYANGRFFEENNIEATGDNVGALLLDNTQGSNPTVGYNNITLTSPNPIVAINMSCDGKNSYVGTASSVSSRYPNRIVANSYNGEVPVVTVSQGAVRNNYIYAYDVYGNDAVENNGATISNNTPTGNNISYYVSDSTGDDDNNGSESAPFKTIGAAIARTNTKKIFNIYILEGTYKGQGNTNLTVPGDHTINFIGSGINKTVIDGDANFTIGKDGSVWGGSAIWNTWYNCSGNWFMNITSGEGLFTVTDMTIQNCWSNSGSSITLCPTATIDNRATLNATNVYFNKNHAGNGAGIRNYDGGTLYVDNCIFENGTKAQTTGNFGAAIYNNGTAIVTNTLIIDNYARWGSVTNDKNITMINCTFKNNHAYDAGSTYKNGPSFTADTGFADYFRMYAVYNVTSTIINCTFDNNGQCDISNGRGDLWVEGCTFNHSTGVYLFPNNNKMNTYIPTQVITGNTFVDMQPSTVFTSTISSTTPSVGIRALSGYDLTIENNNIDVDSTDYSYGIYVTANATVKDNILNDYIFLNGANNTVTNNTINTNKESTIALANAAKGAVITDNTLYAGFTNGDLSIRNVQDDTVVENNKPETNTYVINDDNYATYFDENGILKNDVVTNGSLITFVDNLTNKYFVFDNIKVSVDVNTTLYNTTIITQNNAHVMLNNLKIDNAKTDEDYVILFESENNAIKNGNINVTTDKPVQIIKVEEDGNLITGTTINATIPAADVIWNKDYTIGNVPSAGIFIRSSYNKVNNTKLYIDSTTNATGSFYPTVDGIDIQSKLIGEFVTGNEIRSSRINVTGGSYVYGLNIARAKETVTPLSWIDVTSTFYAVGIQIGDSDNNNISGYIYSKADDIAYGYYSTGMASGITNNTNASKLYLQGVEAPNAIGIGIEGASNLELSSATYTISGENVTGIDIAPDYMGNKPENINIYSLTVNLNGESDESEMICVRNSSNVNIYKNNIKSTSGNGVVLNGTTDSSVTDNYINAANIVGGDDAVYTSDASNIVVNNTPKIGLLTDETYPDFFDENNTFYADVNIVTLGGDLHNKILKFANTTQVINITNAEDYTMYNSTIVIAGNNTSGSFGLNVENINFNNTNKPVYLDEFNATKRINVKFINDNIYITGDDIVAFDAFNNKSDIYVVISKTNILMEGQDAIAVNYAGYNCGQPIEVTQCNITVIAQNKASVLNANNSYVEFNNNDISVSAKEVVVANLGIVSLESWSGFQDNIFNVIAENPMILNMTHDDTYRRYIRYNEINVQSTNPATLINITGKGRVQVYDNEIILDAFNGETPVISVDLSGSDVYDNYILARDVRGDNAVENITGVTIEDNRPGDVITDDTYSDFFDSDGVLIPLFNNSALIVSGEFEDNTVFIFDGVNVTLTSDGTAVFYDGQMWTGAGASVVFDGFVFDNTVDAFVLESQGNVIKNTIINIDSDEEIHAIYVYDDNNIITDTTINITAPSANVVYNPDYSVKTPAPAAIVINSNNNLIEDTSIFFDGTEAIHSEDPSAWDAPTVNGIYIVSSSAALENNTIEDTSVDVIGGYYAYGINVGNAKNTILEDVEVDVASDYYANGIQLFDADTISISGDVCVEADSEAYGVYSTAMGTGYSKNIILDELDITVDAPLATGVLIEGSSNVTMTDSTYEIGGNDATAISAYVDWMGNIPTNIFIDELDITVSGNEENSVLYFGKADTVSITNSEIVSRRGSEINFNKTPNSQVVGNYIKINDVIFGDYAVISTENDTIVENNTPVSKKMEEMQETIDELQKELDDLKAAKNTTLTLDEITDAKYNGNVTISGTLVNDEDIGLFNQIITLTIGDEEVNVTTKGGIFEYTTLFKEVGEKTVTAKYAGTDKYLESEANMTFTIGKQDIIITYDPIADVAYTDNVTITGKFTQANGKVISNSNVNVYINGKQYKARTDKTGAFSVSAPVKTVGTNNVTLSYGGNTYYNSYETNTTFTTGKQDIIITYDPITNVAYGDNVTITGKFTQANGKAISNSNVNVYINGKQYKARTDSTGAFTLSVRVNAMGTNNVTLSYGGNDYYNSYETSTTFSTDKQDILITYDPIQDTRCGENVTITGKFTESNGKAISNSNVNVYINGKQYKARTDKTGAFTFSAETKEVGTNNVTLSYGGNACYNSYETSTTFNVIAKNE